MKKFTLIFIIVTFSTLAFAAKPGDTTYWKSKYESALTFSQTTLTNWAAGGENSITSNIMLNVFKDYAKGKVSWNNYLGLAYGLAKQESFDHLRKTDDKINFLSKAGLYAWKNWDYTALFEFKSQFAEGYKYPNETDYISKFLAPGYFQLSLGLNYKPVEYFSVFISPLGARLTLVNDSYLTNRPGGAFGVLGDNNTLWQVGGSVNALFKKEIMKNVNLLSKLDLFSDYRNHPENIILGWENNLLMKVNKYISLTLNTMLISDPKTPYKATDGTLHGARAQFKETFGVGFAYSFVK